MAARPGGRSRLVLRNDLSAYADTAVGQGKRLLAAVRCAILLDARLNAALDVAEGVVGVAVHAAQLHRPMTRVSGTSLDATLAAHLVEGVLRELGAVLGARWVPLRLVVASEQARSVLLSDDLEGGYRGCCDANVCLNDGPVHGTRNGPGGIA